MKLSSAAVLVAVFLLAPLMIARAEERKASPAYSASPAKAVVALKADKADTPACKCKCCKDCMCEGEMVEGETCACCSEPADGQPAEDGCCKEKKAADSCCSQPAA